MSEWVEYNNLKYYIWFKDAELNKEKQLRIIETKGIGLDSEWHNVLLELDRIQSEEQNSVESGRLHQTQQQLVPTTIITELLSTLFIIVIRPTTLWPFIWQTSNYNETLLIVALPFDILPTEKCWLFIVIMVGCPQSHLAVGLGGH